MASGRIVVVGASAGGLRALKIVASHLDPSFPAPILVVQHIGSHPSVLPRLLAESGPLPAEHGAEGAKALPGRIYVAPPDRHMILDGDTIRITQGPKENHARPAIDPLFRSAALSRGPDVIGVILTGKLDDGTAGLQAIKACRGTTVVQDPGDAEASSMPASALRYVEVDHMVTLASVAPLLGRLASQPPAAFEGRVPRGIETEHNMTIGKGDFLEQLAAIGKPSTFVCPDCKGALWEVTGAEPPRSRCHTGHGYSLASLQHAQSEGTDGALWGAVRALQEKEMMLQALAKEPNDEAEVRRLLGEAALAAQHAAALRALIEKRD